MQIHLQVLMVKGLKEIAEEISIELSKKQIEDDANPKKITLMKRFLDVLEQ